MIASTTLFFTNKRRICLPFQDLSHSSQTLSCFQIKPIWHTESTCLNMQWNSWVKRTVLLGRLIKDFLALRSISHYCMYDSSLSEIFLVRNVVLRKEDCACWFEDLNSSPWSTINHLDDINYLDKSLNFSRPNCTK